MKRRSILSFMIGLNVLFAGSESVLSQEREPWISQRTSTGQSQQLIRCVRFDGNGFSPIYIDKTLKQALFSMTNQHTAFVEKQEGNLLFISQYEGVNFLVNDSGGRNQSPPGTSNPRRGWVRTGGLENLSESNCRSLYQIATIPPPAVCNNLNSQADINNCAAARYRQADRRLNEVYKQVISKLNQRDREKLIDEQLAWIRGRDASCKDQGRVGPTGSAYPGVRDACLAGETDQRTAELEKYLQK
jgi:uncharacterized protein YecT (DUF1311 family)